MYLTNAIRNAQFSVTRITAAQFTVAHIYLPTLPTPPKNGCRIYRCQIFWLPSFPLPTLHCPVYRLPWCSYLYHHAEPRQAVLEIADFNDSEVEIILRMCFADFLVQLGVLGSHNEWTSD